MIKARFRTKCIVCQARIEVGTLMNWERDEGCWCAECEPATSDALPQLSTEPPAWMVEASEQERFKSTMKSMQAMTMRLSVDA